MSCHFIHGYERERASVHFYVLLVMDERDFSKNLAIKEDR